MAIMWHLHVRETAFPTALSLLALAAPQPLGAQVPGGCNTPVAERTSPIGCYVAASKALDSLPPGPLFWYLYNYPTRAAAEAAGGPRGTVVESFGRVWLYVVTDSGWHPASGTRVAVIGPLVTAPGKRYTARYLETVTPPGMQSDIHRHAGPEAWYVPAGAQCLETPKGTTVVRAGESSVVAEGPPMLLRSIGGEQRRAVVLVLHDATQAWVSMATDWQPKGLCPK